MGGSHYFWVSIKANKLIWYWATLFEKGSVPRDKLFFLKKSTEPIVLSFCMENPKKLYICQAKKRK